jgi:preprotein translocase subunit YajC
MKEFLVSMIPWLFVWLVESVVLYLWIMIPHWMVMRELRRRANAVEEMLDKSLSDQ